MFAVAVYGSVHLLTSDFPVLNAISMMRKGVNLQICIMDSGISSSISDTVRRALLA